MSSLSPAKTDRIATTVGRLRQLLSDFADLDSDLRRQFVADEIGRALILVDSAEQQPFLQEVRNRFGPANAAPTASDGKPPVPSESEVVEVLDSTLVELALERARADTGAGDAGMSEEQAVHDLCAALGIVGGHVDPVRAIAMATMLAQFSNSMTTLAWMAWRAIAPNSSIRRGSIAQKLFARYVAGDPAVTHEQVSGELERLRQLIASLISAISQVGEQFARAHLDKFTPAEIEQAVAAESSGGMFRSREARYWRKYVQLAESLDQNAIESEIRRVIGQHAEHLMRGIGRTSP